MKILLYSIVFGIVYIVFLYFQKVRRNSRCVADAVMTAYQKGQLKEGDMDYEHLIAHLGTCAKCRQRMSEI